VVRGEEKTVTSGSDENRDHSDDNVPALLTAWSQGDQSALEKLVPLIDTELRRLAKHYLRRERRGHTLQTTALVNEAYLRLIEGAKNVRWQNRAHFIAVAATLMRRILVDHARKRSSGRRGGNLVRETFGKALEIAQEMDVDLIALDELLKKLADKDERAMKVVELRFFLGLSVEETAEVLDISTDTVRREWNFARNWLLSKLR
jgi:RNA polymerase sigma factor (TIGR02999 family)